MSLLKFSRRKRGFTLIELLVVMTLISLIASIVLVGVYQRKREAEDQTIIRDLDQIRKEAEAFYVKHDSYQGLCAVDGTLSNNGYLGQLEAGINDKGGTIECEDGSSEYAVSSSLNQEGYWCVDSHGASRKIDSPVSTVSCFQ